MRLAQRGMEGDLVGMVTLTLEKISNGVDGPETIESPTTGSANTGNLFRFDDSADQYIYNINIKGLAVGTYRITISGGGGTKVAYFKIVP